MLGRVSKSRGLNALYGNVFKDRCAYLVVTTKTGAKLCKADSAIPMFVSRGAVMLEGNLSLSVEGVCFFVIFMVF
eukprot:XP_001705225.1 Hypothetical protein GL50803_95447 [Giardia lamblia ATCC 50803]